MLLAIVVWVFACHRKPAKPIAQLKPATVPSSTFDEANRVLRRSRQLDYSTYPARLYRFREEAARLFERACRDGDRRACVLVVSLAIPSFERERDERQLLRNCTVGDQMSCRAVAVRPWILIPARIPSTPRAAYDLEGYTRACYGALPSCDTARLREECALGFPVSCDHLARDHVTGVERDHYARRAVELASAGCKAGILTECTDILADSESAADRVLALTRACELGSSYCNRLGNLHLELGEVTKARDAYELAVQTLAFDGGWLGEAYVTGELPEPVPHRGRRLLEYSCEYQKTGCDLLSKLAQ